MAKWRLTRTAGLGGRFQLVITRPGFAAVDVTSFRGAPTQLDTYSNGDPFGDGAASFTFPKLSIFEDLSSPDVGSWLADFAQVDLWWLPGAKPGPGDTNTRYINPLTGALDVIAAPYPAASAIKAWEGFIASIDATSDDSSNSVQIQCQGALYQGDRYLAKPFFPPRPVLLETLLRTVFDRSTKPHLRTQPLQVQFPAGWKLRVPKAGTPNAYTIEGTPNSLYTGYTTRSTGSWDRALTGFAQDLLAVMLTQDDSGVTPGNQWTIQHQRQIPRVSVGRLPILMVRDRFRAPDFEFWVGTPGVKLQLTRDSTQQANIIYGDGTGIDGTVWRNAVISNDGSRTDYKPLAAAGEIYPYDKKVNPQFSAQAFASEAYLKYGSGFSQDLAITSAKKTLQRDQSPGWSGTLSFSVDPSAGLPRVLVRAGMTVKLKGLWGTGATGMNFHIAEVTVNPMSGEVECKIDTRYRDLLNLEESLVRTRDPLTPSKLLQVNRASVVIEDILAPWDYNAGSGYIPKTSKPFFDYKPSTEAFPYNYWATHHPPFRNPQFYVKINANAATRAGRWTQKPIPILTSEKGSIRRAEFVAMDKYGNILKIPFHVSLYYYNVTVAAMPRDRNGPSPFINGAFEKINTATGLPWPPGNFLAPDPSMIIGWGNYQQRAGFSPGRETDGGQPTGQLVDEGSWSFDNTFRQEFQGNPKPQKFSASAITIYAMFYAEYSEPVYFLGRLFKEVQGT